jgi:membrane-associated phospholipid phosphatase
MNKLSRLIRDNKLFFVLYSVLAVIAITIILFFTKHHGFRVMNPYHHVVLNLFFSTFTYLGDGMFAVALGLFFLLLKQRRLCLLILSSYVLSGLIAQVLKEFIVELRPGSSPELNDYKYFLQDTLHGSKASFPSGHATTAFALAAVISFWYKDKRIGVLALLLAVMVGYSRIYTGNHFLIDVLAGSFLGLGCSIICWLALVKKTWFY